MDDKKVLEIEIRDKVFNIGFVSNWVIHEYENLNKRLVSLQELYNKLELFPPKEEIKIIADEIKKIGGNLLNDKLAIVEEILISNDIEYDRKWWERKTNTEDVAIFLNKCAFKDTIINGKKKAVQA